MIPRVDISSLSPELPGDATFWVPVAEEIDEEGFGYFRDVWAIVDVDRADAVALLQVERDLLRVMDAAAADATAFDHLARVLEWQDEEEADLAPDQLELLRPWLDGVPKLEGLELGVAGLVHAMSAVGMFPAASCRGHVGERAWSTYPVVLFAADRARAELLARLLHPGSGGFVIDQARPDLLALGLASVEDAVAVAEALLAAER